MFSKKDIQMLDGMMRIVLRESLRENNEIFGRELKREIRDEMHSVVNSAVFVSETRMMNRMDKIRNEILDGVADVLGRQIVPQIDDHELRLVRLEHGATS